MMPLNEFLYKTYLATKNKKDFFEQVRQHSIYSNCEEEVINSMYELIDFVIDEMS